MSESGEEESGEEVEDETEADSDEDESESGEEVTDSDSSDEEEDEEESEEAESSEEEEEEESECSDSENQTLAKSVIEKKTIHFNKTVNESIAKKANSSRLVKSAIKKTPGFDKSKQFKANESLANRRKSIIENEMTRDQVI